MKIKKDIAEISKLIRKIENLRRILPMLSSNSDGEVSNAVKIITAKLKQHSLDWHDVVDVLFDENAYKVKIEIKTEYIYRPYEQREKDFPDQYPEWKIVKNTGNYFADVNGHKCTIFKSKKYLDKWDVVVNTDEGPVFYNNFSTVSDAKNKIYSEYLSF